MRAVLRRAKEHRHPIERRPACGFGEDEARDLHALAALAGSGEHRHGFVGVLRGLVRGRAEEARPELRERAVVRVWDVLLALHHAESRRRELDRAVVAGRDHGERGGRLVDERLDEIALRAAPQRDVDEEERSFPGPVRPNARHAGRDRERPRAIGELRRLELCLVRGEQAGEVRVGDLLRTREAKLPSVRASARGRPGRSRMGERRPSASP